MRPHNSSELNNTTARTMYFMMIALLGRMVARDSRSENAGRASSRANLPAGLARGTAGEDGAVSP
jgi:hypothetical protein